MNSTPLLSQSPLDVTLTLEVKFMEIQAKAHGISTAEFYRLLGVKLADTGVPHRSHDKRQTRGDQPSISTRHKPAVNSDAEVDRQVREVREKVDEALSRLERCDIEG